MTYVLHTETTGAIIRVLPPGGKFGVNRPVFTVHVVGDAGNAILKDAHGRFDPAMREPIADELKAMGFTHHEWDRAGDGGLERKEHPIR